MAPFYFFLLKTMYGNALSGDDILNHPVTKKYPVNIISYPELSHVRDVDELFGPENRAVILLYNVRKCGDGHWVLLLRHLPTCRACTLHRSNYGPDGRKCQAGVVEFFDPYGSSIDFVLSLQDPARRARLKQREYVLSHLLGSSPYCIVYNDQQLQRKHNSVETCGHHCLARLRMRHCDVDTYSQLLRAAGNDPDVTVTEMYNLER